MSVRYVGAVHTAHLQDIFDGSNMFTKGSLLAAPAVLCAESMSKLSKALTDLTQPSCIESTEPLHKSQSNRNTLRHVLGHGGSSCKNLQRVLKAKLHAILEVRIDIVLAHAGCHLSDIMQL